MPDEPTIHVIIRTRQDVIYDGRVTALSSLNDTGPFDVLPEHANFISIVKDMVTLHFPNDQKQLFRLQTGILHVEENEIKLYIEA